MPAESVTQKLDPNGRLGAFVDVVQQLSLARSLDAIMAIVRRAARALTGADGATFVLHDAGLCYYADEDAIEPLWKGKRFPLEACISGWAMTHRQAVAIPDIYADPRIPFDAYRPTFVKSLAMVPIRSCEPIGAIGNYWATPHTPTADELELLQALANCTSVAMENVAIATNVEARTRAHALQLEAAENDLEAYRTGLSHDLRAPVRWIDGFAQALEEDAGPTLNADSKQHVARVREAAHTLNRYIDGMLSFAKVSRDAVKRQPIDLTLLVRTVMDDVARSYPGREVVRVVQPGLTASADEHLLRAALENLIDNAFKFTGQVAHARIEVGGAIQDGETAYFVKDNGAGLDMRFAAKLFAPFQRLHSTNEFPGSGIGLATVKRIVLHHGGRIWVESSPGHGATFWFTLPAPA